MTSSLRRELVVAACAASAGVHAALAPGHAHHGIVVVAGFTAAATALAIGAVAVGRAARRADTAAAVLLAALLVAYLAAGEVDPVGLATKAVETGGLLLAVELRGERPTRVTLAGAPIVALAAGIEALLLAGGHAH